MTKHIHGQVNRPVVIGSGDLLNPDRIGSEHPDVAARSITIQGDSDVPGSKKKVYLRVPIEHVPGLIDHLQRFLRIAPQETPDA